MGRGKGKAGTLRSAAPRIGPFCSFSLGGDETASARGPEVSGEPGGSSRGQRNERAIAISSPFCVILTRPDGGT